jgi:streptogramin lyase
VAVDRGTLWLSAPEEGSVIRIDARTGRPAGNPTTVGGEPLDIEALDGDVWVDLGEAEALAHIDGRSGRLLGRVRDVDSVFAIALGFGSVWATNYGPDTVTRVDAATGRRIGRPIATGADPNGVVAGAGAVWVAGAGACTVTRIDPGPAASAAAAPGAAVSFRFPGAKLFVSAAGDA